MTNRSLTGSLRDSPSPRCDMRHPLNIHLGAPNHSRCFHHDQVGKEYNAEIVESL